MAETSRWAAGCPSVVLSSLVYCGGAPRRLAHSLSILPHRLVTLLMPMVEWTSPSHPSIFRRPTRSFCPPPLFLSQLRFQGWTSETRPERYFCNPPFGSRNRERQGGEKRRRESRKERESVRKREKVLAATFLTLRMIASRQRNSIFHQTLGISPFSPFFSLLPWLLPSCVLRLLSRG